MDYRYYIGFLQGIYSGYIEIMEKKNGNYRASIGVI